MIITRPSMSFCRPFKRSSVRRVRRRRRRRFPFPLLFAFYVLATPDRSHGSVMAGGMAEDGKGMEVSNANHRRTRTRTGPSANRHVCGHRTCCEWRCQPWAKQTIAFRSGLPVHRAPVVPLITVNGERTSEQNPRRTVRFGLYGWMQCLNRGRQAGRQAFVTCTAFKSMTSFVCCPSRRVATPKKPRYPGCQPVS